MRINNVSKAYEDEKVLDDISLAIEKGKITAFIGPNGAGKSTLLSVISRLLAKDEGILTINGKEIEAWQSDELARELSILKQQNAYQVRMTVRELVSFGRFPYTKGRLNDEDQTMIDKVLGYLNLEGFANRYLDTLSGGQLQRAAIAMILVQDTEYILLDEPLNNLDLKQSIVTMQTIRNLADELGKTILVVIHDVNFASVFSDNIIAMKNGKIFRSGSVEEVIRTQVLQELYEVPLEVITTADGKKHCTYQAI
ncbi:ATP-binding cassette domain-containing protein [uncultured Trichococcus sp.]|uniref:iron ABC transporter ATP-binding protein n=1 Tax=uncultured Trichococcus sp. TaxID=189665 RepID=UPI0029C604A3|nr:ATP-binding cassette domain-containing protein [uncultured Trichococcus sp.]